LEIFEYLRTGYELNPNLWHQLHNLYDFTEHQKLHKISVHNPLNTTQSHTTCCNIYVKTLLACDAHPAELTRSQLHLLDGWLNTWSAEIQLERHYSISSGDALPLAVDLSSTQGLQSATQVQDNEGIRYLALVPLSKLLRVKIILLEQGSNSEKVGLGKLSNTEECVELLNFLHKCWCESHSEAVQTLRKVAKAVQLCHVPVQIFGQLTGKPFAQPRQIISAANREQTGAFGTVSEAKRNEYKTETLENWWMESDNILGAQLRREALVGSRLGHAELIALRRDETQKFILAVITWLKVTRTGALQMGVRYLPNFPEPIHIRLYGLNQSNELYHAAFLLPAVRELNIPSSLILPRQWFKPKRVIEILTQKGLKMTLQLGMSVEKGADYERVSFEPIRI
jgi:hypothetical protein